MDCTRRSFVSLATGAALLGLSACNPQQMQSATSESSQVEASESAQQVDPEVDKDEFKELALDAKAWKYDKDNNVYYQLGVPYCLKPGSISYETLAIFVPGAYFSVDKEDKKAVPEINPEAKVGAYTAATAPVLMPINSGVLGAQASPTSYSFAGLGNYLKAGFVYVYAGFRGRSAGYESDAGSFSGGCPWPVVDLKAAVRFLRYNAGALPCDTSRVFTFGFSAGGGVSSLMGCTGDSELYAPYLKEIGAATHDDQGATISDAVYGAASWCPVTSFDTADASYEWMMGQYFSEGTRADGTWTKLLSDNLTRAYANYVNSIDLRDADDQALVLDETTGELFADGSYYTHLLACLEEAADKFFANTQFPYTYTPQHLSNANFPGDPNLQSVGTGASDIAMVTGDASAQAAGVTSAENPTSNGIVQVQSVVYNSETDYVDALNQDVWWLTYNERHGTVRIASLGEFARHLKTAAKDVCAFDAFDRSSMENQIFGVDDESSLHFSKMVHEQLAAGRESYAADKNWNEQYIADWASDLAKTDSLKTDMETRVNMFNPLYFLSGACKGFGTAKVAPHWRINSGLFQTDTSLCTEMNMALALKHYEGVASVSFTPVWGQGHVLAEITGTAEENLIAWVGSCCA